jgi:hypothetical protein
MRLALYTFFIIFLFLTKSYSIINVKDYQNIFLKYNLSDDYNFQNISSICLEKHKDNNTKTYRNDKNEEILEINDEQGFLGCTYAEILKIIKPIPVVNSLQQKPLEKFILENEITITKGLNQEKFTFVFNDKEYIQYKNNEEILRDGWRWGKIAKPLRVFMNGEKTTWKVSIDKMALTIKVGKEKAVPYFLTYENKQVAQKKRDDLIAKQKLEKEKIRKDKIEKERLAKLNELKEDKLKKLDKIVKDNEENYNKLFQIIDISTKMKKNSDELNSILNDYEKKINDIKNEIVNFDNFKNLENYQIFSDFIDPLNKILNQPENNLDKLKSEYELFKIEEEKRLAEEERKKIEEEKRLAEEERKRIEEEQRIAAEKEKKYLSEYSNVIDGYQNLKFGTSIKNLYGGNCGFKNSDDDEMTNLFLGMMKLSPAGSQVLTTMSAKKILLSEKCNKVLGEHPIHLLGFDELDRLTSVVLYEVKKFNFLNENAQDRFDQIIDQLDKKYSYWLPNNFSEKQIDLWRNDYNNNSMPIFVKTFAQGEVASIVTKHAQTGEHILSIGYYSPNSKFREKFIDVLRRYNSENTGSGL